MADSIFLRAPDQELVKHLNARYRGETNLRAQSFLVESQLNEGTFTGDPMLESPHVFTWAAIYNEEEQLVLARGDEGLVFGDGIRPGIKTFSLEGEPTPVYGFESLTVELGGSFGSLRSCTFTFDINFRQPEEITDEWNEIFTFAEQSFFVGKKILIQYGYLDPSVDPNVIGYNEKFHRTPTGADDVLPIANASKKGYIFTVMNPTYTIRNDGTVRFTIEGIGPGGEASERSILPQAGNSFGRVFKGGAVEGDKVYKSPVEQDQHHPYFVADYSERDDDERFLKVLNLVDWIDFDVQSRIRKFRGEDADDDFASNNGAGLLGANHWNPPQVDPTGDYKNVGFVCFNFESEKYYDNPFAINDSNMGDAFAYYVTLQYLAWIINWTAQSDKIDIDTPDSKRLQIQRKGVPDINDGKPMDDVFKYIVKCDSETTRGYLKRKTKNIAGEQEEFWLPSADPLSVLYTYGNYREDPALTANYGCLQTAYNWLYGAAGGVVAVGGSILSAGVASPPAILAGSVIAAKGFSQEKEDVLVFSDPDFDKLQASDMGGRSHTAFQSALSLQDGDLSKILINRDCIAAIIDELGGLKRPDVSSKEGNLAKSSALQGNLNTDVTKISIESFFNKLFAIIKSSSGGAVDLFLQPDPDVKSVFESKLLIKNRNEKPEEKLKIPMFNKNDGNVIQLFLTSKIPKAQQVAAAVGTDQTLPPDEPEADESIQKENQEAVPVSTSMYSDILSSKDALTKSKFSSDSVEALTELLKTINSGQSKKDLVEFGNQIFPLEMTLRIQGVEGFKFGDVIQCKMIPRRYLNKDGFNRIIFSVLSVNHLHGDFGWETELKTIMRFMPDSLIELLQIDSETNTLIKFI